MTGSAAAACSSPGSRCSRWPARPPRSRPNADCWSLARALQGIGGAAVLPLSLTLLTSAVAPDRRGAALGIWGASSGLAVALGPLLGGAITQGGSWQYIFWLNVPIGLALIPLAMRRLGESRGPAKRLDPVGLGLVSVGLFALVFGLVRGNAHGWTTPRELTALVGGGAAARRVPGLGERGPPRRCCRCGCSAPAASPPSTSRRC